jgi:hypothetical protein
MTTHDANERKPLVEFRGRDHGGRNERGGRPRFPALARSVLIFAVSLAACGFLTWWLWTRFRIRFYFIFIPLIGFGGPLFGRLRRNTGPGQDRESGVVEEHLLEDRRDEGDNREGRGT